MSVITVRYKGGPVDFDRQIRLLPIDNKYLGMSGSMRLMTMRLRVEDEQAAEFAAAIRALPAPDFLEIICPLFDKPKPIVDKPKPPKKEAKVEAKAAPAKKFEKEEPKPASKKKYIPADKVVKKIAVKTDGKPKSGEKWVTTKSPKRTVLIDSATRQDVFYEYKDNGSSVSATLESFMKRFKRK